MSTSPDLFKRAVESAKDGQRDSARLMLLELVEQQPGNVQAWVLLSRLAGTPAEKLVALDNALALRPWDEDLQARREGLLQAYPELRRTASGLKSESTQAGELFSRAEHFLAAGKRDQAIALLQKAVAENPGEERAWQVLSEIHPNPEEKIKAVERALALNPGHYPYQQRLDELRLENKDPLQRGRFLEERGEFEQAITLYQSVVVHSRSAAERVEAQRRIENLHTHQEAHTIQPVHPNLNLLRLTVGPVLLFGIMVLMQSGLNPFHLSLLALIGLLSVLSGALLVAATEMRPAPPKWVELFGQPGTGDEPEMRRALRLLGWALLLAPYTMFLIDAGHRLEILQTSVLGGLH